MSESREKAQALAREYLDQGRFEEFFESLYAGADGRAVAIPWAKMTPNPDVTEWIGRVDLRGQGKTALVVGCGLGDDAEMLAALGFDVTAFDVSRTAIDWCRRRFPESSVDYLACDLFATPAEWSGQFDFILECHTIQSLPPQHHEQAMGRIASCLRNGGTLLLLCSARDDDKPVQGPPWSLARSDLETLRRAGLSCEAFDEIPADPDRGGPQFCITYRL